MTRRKTFDLGQTPRSSTLALPNEFAGRRSAIFGISGSGKSNTATVCIEGLIANGEQVIVVDPKGEGWGLLSNADGTPSDLELIVFGEPNGHIEAIDPSHGPRLADFAVDSGRSIVLSLLGFESDASERRFVTAFLKQLYRRKSRQAQAARTLVVLEEAHLFVPENPRGDQAELAGAVQRIVRQGRSQGIGTLLVDQRPQDVAKRVITQCETILCHQLVHKLDRDALRDWVRGFDRDNQGETFLASLASLQPGEAWVWSPGWMGTFERVQVRRRSTFDTGASPDGSDVRKVERAEVNLEALREQLQEVVAKAEQEDPRKLQAQIRTLQGELAAAKAAAPAEPDPQVVESVVQEAVAERDAEWARQVDEFRRQLQQVVQDLNFDPPTSAPRATGRPPSLITRRKMMAADTSRGRQNNPGNIPPQVTPSLGVTPSSVRDEGISAAQQRVLDALAWWESIRVAEPARHQVAFVAGYTVNGHFNNLLGALRTSGHLDYPDKGRVRLTDAGRAVASPPPPGEVNWHSLVARVREVLKQSALQKVFGEVVGAHEGGQAPIGKQQLAALCGYTVNGHFNNLLGRLRSLGLISYPQPGAVDLSDLFAVHFLD